jgi:hypothetical protein
MRQWGGSLRKAYYLYCDFLSKRIREKSLNSVGLTNRKDNKKRKTMKRRRLSIRRSFFFFYLSSIKPMKICSLNRALPNFYFFLIY